MTHNPSQPKQIKIRVPLPLYDGGKGRADLTLKVVDNTTSFDLQPIRYFRPTDAIPESATQWYLNCQASVKAHIEIQLADDRIWQRGDIEVTTPIELGLGQAEQDEPFFVVYGAITIPLTFPDDSQADKVIRQLWITGNLQDISALLIQPSGLYLRGLLPKAFYLKEPKSVTLRVPQTSEDVVNKDDLLDKSFADLNLATKRFWTLSSFDVSGDLNAIAHVKTCADRFETFRLQHPGSNGKKPRLTTFLDNVECRPGSDCIVQLFNSGSGSFVKQIDWIGQFVNTRLSFGGDVAAEANFQPQFLTGQLQRSAPSSAAWTRTQLQFESARTSTQLPEITLTLTTASDNHSSVPVEKPVEFSLAQIQVQAISMPATALLEEAPSKKALPKTRYRSWLCTTTGWMAIDSTETHAEINPEAVTQGVVFGVIELDKLVQGLQSADDLNAVDSPGMVVQVQTLQQSRVVVKLNSLANDLEQLRLELYDLMTTVRTSSVWLQEQQIDTTQTATLDPRVIPAILAPPKPKPDTQKSNESGDSASPPVNGESNQPAASFEQELDEQKLEQILKQGRSPAVFISSNVIKPRNLQKKTAQKLLGLPVVATIGRPIGQTHFQFKFRHGTVLDNLDLGSSQLLFSLGIDLENDLGNQLVSEALRQQFKTKGYLLSQNVIASTKTLSNQEVRWLILDRDTGRGYAIAKQNDTLNVYHTPLQQILVWERPVNYPLVQSFSLSPTQDQSVFLDSNRGLIPYQPQREDLVEVQFPERGQGLPRCSPNLPIVQTDLTGASPWQLVPSLLTSRYFLPTLPGVELNLNAQPVQWIYRHSVPVLDEAYTEVSESQSNRLANTGNVQGRDFTRVQGTEAFTLLPSTSPRRALGWLHKTTSNLEGAVEIEIAGDDTTLRKQLQGRHPQFEFKLINPKTGDRTNPISFSRDVQTSGGLQIPLQVSTSAGTRLPEFTVGIDTQTEEEKQKSSRYRIANNGQPLIAKFDETLQRVVTLDGEGLVQQEAIGEDNAYRLLNQSEQRRITKRFTLGSGLQLDVIGVPLGEFSPNDDLYQQSWMLHDGSGDWPRLGGFPLYPLWLQEISQAAGETTIKLEAVWLYETPPSALTNSPNNAGGKIALTFVGSGNVWRLTAVGQIDWRFPKPENTDSPPHLTRLQAQLKPQQPSESGEFNFENLKVTLDLPVGLVSLAAPSDATCKILSVELGQTKAGVLRFEIPASGGDTFQFRIGTTDIQADGKLPTLDNYSFIWTGSTAKTANPKSSDSPNFVIQGDRGLGISDWQLDEYVRRLQPLPNSDSDDSEAGQPSAQGASENLSQSPVTSAQSQSVDSPQLPPRETLWDLTKGAIDVLTKDTLEDTNEESPSEGAVFVPGTAGKRVLTTLMVARNADYANEFGLFRVDNTQGYIGTLKPGDLGYAQAALAPERRLLTFKATQTEATVKLPGAKFIGAYLIQNSTTLDFLKQNPTNQPEKQPLAFWSFKAANPDNLEHVKIQHVDGGVQLGWEDLAWSSDSDFDDLIVTMKFKPPQPDTELRWKLKFTSSSNWSLDIGRSDDDLTTKALVSLQLTPSRVGAHQFIFMADNQSLIESSSKLPENSWFDRLDKHPDRGFVGVEFEGFQRGVVAVKSLVADLQLRLTDKGDSSTRLVLRLMLNLSNADPSKRFEVEAAGQLTLKNAIHYQTVSPKTAPVEAIHRAKFYFDRAKIPAEAMFQILRGDGPDESVILGGIADHEFNFGNGVTYHWQAPQTVRFMQLEQFVATFLGKPSDRPTEIVLFELEKHQIERDDQIQVLSKVLQILQDNPESTADIKGYTDNSASSDFNQTVSELRAATVRDWLTNQGVDEKRLNVEGLGDSNPRADNKTRPGRAQNRRVEIIIHTIALPETPAGQESRLVVEGGAVFEVKMPKNPKTGKVAAIIPDLENEFIRLGLRPRPIEQLDTAESHASHIVRLPLAAFRNDDQTRLIWPTIELKKPDQSPSAELIYRTSGIQKQIKSPPASFDSDRLSSFDIFNRTPQARWLKSEYLRNAIVWQSDDQTPPVELQPAFWSQGEVTLRFPSTLGDLEWLRDSNLVQNQTKELTAATLVTAYDPDNPGVPVLSRPTLFEYPFTVEDVTENAAKLLPASTIDVQLIIFSNGLLQRIARDRIASKADIQASKADIQASNADIKQWASNLLQAKRRYDAAVVLKNFDQEIISIPRPFEAHLDTRFILNPDPSLGLLVFDATPQIPPEESKLKSVAATRFRLAPTGANSEAFAGKLRPARIPAANSGELLACTKWDEVVFEQCNPQSSAVPAYPKVNPRPLANRPFLPSNFPKPEEDKKTGITSLLPPLIDVVAWASRPGEMTRSLWYLNGFSYPQGNDQRYQLSANQAISVSLRRPRSVAGLDESVRLKVESTQPIFNQQFYYARLLMTQVLGKTPAPSDHSCYGVLVSKNNFYPFTVASAKAESSPALFYYKKNDKTREELERIELFLLAKENFQPVGYEDETKKKVNKKTVLIALDSKAKLPDLKLSVDNQAGDFKEPDKQVPESTQQLLIANLRAPKEIEQGWKRLDESSTYYLQVSGMQDWAQKYIESQLKKGSTNISANIMLVSYQPKPNSDSNSNPTDNSQQETIWEPAKPSIFVASISFLDQGSAIVAPKLGLALLSSPKDKPNESVVLSGYGRLDDDDFSPIKPAATTSQKKQAIEWSRTARLQTLDRINREVLGEPPYSHDNVVYDVVLYGSGGELIPITEPN